MSKRRNMRDTPTGRLCDAARREAREAVLVAAIHAVRGNVVRLAKLLRIPRNNVYQGAIWTRPHLRAEVYRARRGLPPRPLRRSAEAQLARLLGGALAETGGHRGRAAARLGLHKGTLGRHLMLRPGLAAGADLAARASLFEPWLVRAAAVLSLSPMLEQLVAAAQGMSAEEIRADFEASAHAGSADPEAFAEALAAAALDAQGAAGE